MLAVDDAQWADDSSLALIGRLVEEAEASSLCVAISYRDEEARSPELNQLIERPDAERLRPAPLSEAAVELLLERAPNVPAAAGLASTVHDSSRGNPLVLEELLAALARSEGAEGSELGSRSVRELILARLEGAPREVRRLAEALAVIGEAPVGRLARIVGGAERDALGSYRELAERGLIQSHSPAFRHPLVRRTILDSIDARRVEELRLSSARVLAEDGEDAHAGALLLRVGASRSDADWLACSLERAALAAAGSGATNRCEALVERALAEDPGPRLRSSLLRIRGKVRSLVRDPAGVEDLDAALKLAGDPHERGAIALDLASALFYLVRLREAAERARQTILENPDLPRELRLRLEAQGFNADRLLGINPELPWNFEAEVRGAASPGERAVLAHVAAEGVARGDRPHTEVVRLARRAWGAGELLRGLGAAAPVLSFLGTTLAWAEDYRTVFELTDATLAEGRQQRAPVTVSFALALRAGTRLRVGDLADAEADAEQVIAELPASDPLAHMICVGWLIEARLERGAREHALRALGESGLAGELPDLGTVDFLLLSRGKLRLADGNADLALVDFEEVGRRAERSHYLNPAGMAWRSWAALAHLDRGEADRARSLARDEVELARAFGAPRALGLALTVGGRCEDSVALTREAVESLGHSQDRLGLARAQIQLGEMELERARNGAAITHLREGIDGAHRCGAVPLVDRAMDGLRAAGHRPRRPAIRGVDALTSQQLRVARLATEGLSNREIAEALFLTSRTVEMHLSRSYRKLGIESREQLPSALTSGRPQLAYRQRR